MNRLHFTVIRDLADQFCAAGNVAAKQDIVDQLGMHPVNHAWFARFLAVEHQNDTNNPVWHDEGSIHWTLYLQLTATIRADNM